MAKKEEKAGEMYAVEGAIYKCPQGSIPAKIVVASHQKVYAQGKPMVTDKDAMFQVPVNIFGKCNLNFQMPNMCTCTSFQWKEKSLLDHGQYCLATERSVMVCPIYNAEIKCISSGQVMNVTAKDWANFQMKKMVILAPFAKYLDVASADEEVPKKVSSSVSSISYNTKSSDIRVNDHVFFSAYKKDKKKKDVLCAENDLVNWAVVTEEKKPEDEDSETETKKAAGNKKSNVKEKNDTIIGGISIYQMAGSSFHLRFPKAGKYRIEAFGGETTLNNYLALKNGSVLQKTPPYDPKCSVVLNVLENNSIEKVEVDGSFYEQTKDGDTTYHVRQGETIKFIIKTKLPYDTEFDLIKCRIVGRGRVVALRSDFSLDHAKKELSITPSNMEVDYYIRIMLYHKKKSDAKYLISVFDFHVHSYNDVVLYAYYDDRFMGNVSLRRPGERLRFAVNKKIDGFFNTDNKAVDWQVFYNNKEIETYKDRPILIYPFKNVGIYKIVADLAKLQLKSAGVAGVGVSEKEQKGDCTSSTVSHTVEVTPNRVLGISVASANGKNYVNGIYKMELHYLFGDETTFEEYRRVKITANEKEVDLDMLPALYFSPLEAGRIKIEAKLDDTEVCSTTINVEEATVKAWYFCNNKQQKVERVGRNSKFGIKGHVPAWAASSMEEDEEEKKITVVLKYGEMLLQTYNLELNVDGSFLIEGIEVEKDVIEEITNRTPSYEVPATLNLTFAVECSSSVWVKGLSTDEKSRYYQKEVSLSVISVFSIEGEFVANRDYRLVDVLKYGTNAFVRLRMLNVTENALKRMRLALYECKEEGEDPIVFEQTGFTLDECGYVKIKIPTNEGSIKEEDHGDDPKPRTFYFKVFNAENKMEMVYPPSASDLSRFNLIEEQANLEKLTEKDKEGDYMKKARNYFWLLKLSKMTKDDNYINVYNMLAPVVVGDYMHSSSDEDYKARCPHCIEPSKDMAEKLGKAFPKITDKNRLQEISDIYTQYQKVLGMDSCWVKAVYFAMAYMESGEKIDKLTESLDYTAKGIKETFKTALSSVSNPDAKAKELGRPENVVETEQQKQQRYERLANFVYGYQGNDLGNKQPGDGWKYRGRSFCHITGRTAYTEINKILRSVGIDEDIENHPEKAADLKVAVVASMAFFRWKRINMRHVCDGFIPYKKINFDATGQYSELRGLNPVLKKMGNDKIYDKGKTMQVNGKSVTYKTNHQGKKLAFKNFMAKAFELNKCQFAYMDRGDSGIMTYHIYDDGRVIKHIPKNISNPDIYRYVYHTQNNAYIVAERAIIREGFNFTHSETVLPSDEQNLSLLFTYRDNEGIDGKCVKAHYNENGVLDYAVAYKKEKSNFKKLKYYCTGDRIEMVRIDNVPPGSDEQTVIDGEHHGTLSFYVEDEVFFAYRVKLESTDRCYSHPSVLAIAIAILAQYGKTKMEEVKAKFKDELNDDPNDTRPVYCPYKRIVKIKKEKDGTVTEKVTFISNEFCREGTGNADKYGVGYPSRSHVGGCAFDFCYGPKSDDDKIVKIAHKHGFDKIYCGTFSGTVQADAIKNSGHNDHLHLGELGGNEIATDAEGNIKKGGIFVSARRRLDSSKWVLPMYKEIKEEDYEDIE